MHRSTAILLLSVLSGCVSIDHSPPKYIYDAWSKSGNSVDGVTNDMRLCGYKDTRLANDISQSEAAQAEQCMVAKGYALDLKSYRPNNCYGNNSPYLCNRFWGGQKPQPVPVRHIPR